MPQSDLHLKRVFCDAFRQLDPGGKRFQPDVAAIEVKFYPYAGLHHTIRVRAVAHHIAQVPRGVDGAGGLEDRVQRAHIGMNVRHDEDPHDASGYRGRPTAAAPVAPRGTWESAVAWAGVW